MSVHSNSTEALDQELPRTVLERAAFLSLRVEGLSLSFGSLIWRMRALFLATGFLFTLSGARAAEKPGIYTTDYWEILGAANTTTWVEIHNSKEAQGNGVAHVSVLTRKKGAPVWELNWVCDHIAITTDALKRSVTRPFKTRGAYPERYYEALRQWRNDQKNGKATICSTSIQEWLRRHQ